MHLRGPSQRACSAKRAHPLTPLRWPCMQRPLNGDACSLPRATLCDASFFFLYVTFPVIARTLHVLSSPNKSCLSTEGTLRAAAVLGGAIYLAGGIAALHLEVEGYYYNSGLFAVPCFVVGCCAGRERRLQTRRADAGIVPSATTTPSRDDAEAAGGGPYSLQAAPNLSDLALGM